MFLLSEQSTQIRLRGANGRDKVNVEGWSVQYEPQTIGISSQPISEMAPVIKFLKLSLWDGLNIEDSCKHN